MQKKSPGYTTIVVLIMLTCCYFIFNKILQNSLLHSVFTKNYLSQVQAKNLVLAAITIKLTEMTLSQSGELLKVEKEGTDQPKESEAKKESDDKKPVGEEKTKTVTTQDRFKSYFIYLLKNLNSWQETILTKDKDGIEAKLLTCLTCEEGKISLQSIYDKQPKKESPDKPKQDSILKYPFSELFKNFKIANISQDNGLMDKILINFLQSKQAKEEPFFDITQLGFQEKVEFFKNPEKQASAEQDAKDIYMTDLFSLFNQTGQINPFMISESVKILLKIPVKTNKEEAPVVTEEAADKKRSPEAVLKAIQNVISVASGNNWEELQPLLYEFLGIKNDNKKSKNPGAENSENPSQQSSDSAEKPEKKLGLMDLKGFFSTKIEPEFFTLHIIVYYQNIRLRAVLVFRQETIAVKYRNNVNKKSEPKKDDAKEVTVSSDKPDATANRSNSPSSSCFFLPEGFEIIRFYWL